MQIKLIQDLINSLAQRAEHYIPQDAGQGNKDSTTESTSHYLEVLPVVYWRVIQEEEEEIQVDRVENWHIVN